MGFTKEAGFPTSYRSVKGNLTIVIAPPEAPALWSSSWELTGDRTGSGRGLGKLTKALEGWS
jgi:hypothetical protein